MSAQSDRIGIEFISFFNEHPVEMVKVAANLGCKQISLALESMSPNKLDYAPWSLRNNKQLRRDLLRAVEDHGVNISNGEFYMIKPGTDFRDTARPDLEIMCGLNFKRVNIVSIEPDFSRNVDQCGVLVEMAQALGMETTLEFVPNTGVANLQSALNILQAVNRPTFGLVIDAMHFFRSGSSVADLAKLEPDTVGYVQLCDVPVVSHYEQYMYEALYERLPPGQGELPLQDFLNAVRRDVVVGLEIPMLAQAQAGIAPRERLQGAVAAAKHLLNNIQ